MVTITLMLAVRTTGAHMYWEKILIAIASFDCDE